MFNHHLIKRSLASGLVIAAAMIPAGAAQAFHPEQAGGGLPVATAPASQVATSQPTASSDSSFQWGDAGIGAGAVVLMGAAALGAGATRRRRSAVLN